LAETAASGSVSDPASSGQVGSIPEGAAPTLPAPATRVPLPATTIPTTPGAFVTWDGGSGPSSSRWLNKLEIPWLNAGTGDWLDANQQSQGSAPIAAATISATGPVVFDVAPLVRRWLAGAHNRGFYLSSRQAWPTTFAGRAHASSASRPQLKIVTDTGSFTAPCVVSAHWSSTNFRADDSRMTFRLAKGIWFAVVQFDLSKVTGTVRSATLTVTCESMRSEGVVEIYEANPPGFRIGAGSEKPRQGLALSYPMDRNIESHPKVLFASDFADLSRARWQVGAPGDGSQQIVDSRTNTTYLRGVIPKDGRGGGSLERDVVGGTADGLTDKVETELYARYYVFLEESWGSTVDTNKMPGWDGRFGFWNPRGYWNAITGNGGARPTGKKVWNAVKQRWEYHGASMRGHGGTKAGDGNPYDDLFWLGGYIYHLDQASYYGENVKWTGVVISKGRWFSIEHYIKMNSIVGPYDTVGNGEAVHDGEYRVWVDGVQAYERTNFRWRRHPEMGIQGFWLNWYHGGTRPALTDMHFRMNSVVIARDYIGPRNDG
jgi:hypothetical protein